MTTPRVNVANLSELEIRAIRREYLARRKDEIAALDTLKPSARELELASEIDEELFGPQRKFFDSPAKRKVGYCTRRAGKTLGIAREILRVLLRNPTSLQIYFAQSQVAAKTWMWSELKTIIRRKRLPITWHEQDLWLIHERGGGKCLFRGAEDDDELDKHRGPAYIRVYIDEAGHFRRNLKKLITEVAGPALRDHGGICYMTGTAGPVREGHFFDAVEGNLVRQSDGKPVWELHEWSLQDNPHLSDEAKDERRIIDDDGFTGQDDPRFLREYKKIWAVDTDKRMFAFHPERNVYSGELPSGHEWQGLLGVDFGWNDQTAISMIWYSLTHPHCFIPESWGESKQYTDDVAHQIFEFKKRYGVSRIVGDVGGYGKAIVVHLQRDYGIAISAAKKREKLDHLAFFNSALKRGDLLIHARDELTRQFPKVEWNYTRTGAANHSRDDRCFSALYAWRDAKSSGSGTQVRAEKSAVVNEIREAAIKEKLDILNTHESETAYAHQRPHPRTNPRTHGRRPSALHQLIAGRRR